MGKLEDPEPREAPKRSVEYTGKENISPERQDDAAWEYSNTPRLMT